MAYTKVFERPYSGGWVDYPSETTLITADALNEYDTTFQHVEDYLEDNPIDEKAEQSTISDAYNAATTYVVGDHFIYNDVIYTVDVACTGITPPNSNYYTANNLTDLIEANSSQISDLKRTLIGAVTYSSAIASYNDSTLRKNGNVITCFLDFTVGNTAISGWDASWCKFATGFYPSSGYMSVAITASNNVNMTYLYGIVSADGSFKTGATLSANTRYIITLTYII